MVVLLYSRTEQPTGAEQEEAEEGVDEELRLSRRASQTSTPAPSSLHARVVSRPASRRCRTICSTRTTYTREVSTDGASVAGGGSSEAWHRLILTFSYVVWRGRPGPRAAQTGASFYFGVRVCSKETGVPTIEVRRVVSCFLFTGLIFV